MTTDPADLGDILRATDWDTYVGQERLKQRLTLHINAANSTGRTLDHVFLAGPPGYGKTTIARIVADEVCAQFYELKMPVKPKVLASLLREWDGGVLFLDEIHAASKREQEMLLPLLEEGYLQLDNGRRVYAGDITVIGGTTEPERVIKPLRDRFPTKPRFVDYTDDEMGQVVAGMASKVGLKFTPDDVVRLGRATGGTPRIARSLILTARDMVDTKIRPTVEAILDMTEMTPDGLTAEHTAYLALMRELGGASVGLRTLSTILRLDESTIRELERLLIKKGLIQFESTGRELTNAGFSKAPKKGVA